MVPRANLSFSDSHGGCRSLRLSMISYTYQSRFTFMSTRLADLQVRREMPADLYHLACAITPHPTSLTERLIFSRLLPRFSFSLSSLLELFLRRSFVTRVRELRRGTRHRVFTRVDAVSESLPPGWEEDDPPATDRYISTVAST